MSGGDETGTTPKLLQLDTRSNIAQYFRGTLNLPNLPSSCLFKEFYEKSFNGSKSRARVKSGDFRLVA